MIRLQPTQVALAQSEVDDCKRRGDLRVLAKIMEVQSFRFPRETRESVNRHDYPRVQRGPRRSRDDAVVHSSTMHAPSSATSEGDTVNLSSSFQFPVEYQSHAAPSNDQPSDESDGGVRFRRDSVLSNQEGSSSSAMKKAWSLHRQSISTRDSEEGDTELDTSGSEGGLPMSPAETQWNNTHQEPDGVRLSTISNSQTSKAISRGSTTSLRRSPAQRKLNRGRALSDPSGSQLQSPQQSRAQCHAQRSAHREELCEFHFETIPEHSSSHFSAEETERPLGTVERRDPSTSCREARHLSLPLPPTAGFDEAIGESYDYPRLQSGDSCEPSTDRECFATDEVLGDHGSPLESLSRKARAYSERSWVANVPIRSAHETVVDDISALPGFASSERALSLSPEARSSQEGVEESTSSTDWRGRQSSAQNRAKNSSTASSRIPRDAAAVAIQRPERRPVGQGSSRSTVGNSVRGGGGRPSFGSLQSETQRPVRRRGASSRAEQENEEDMGVFQGERHERLARLEEGRRGGLLDRTPPPEGRLERFLR